jgi:hypothetical protein
MLISATGITDFTAKIKPDFKPAYHPDFETKWAQLSSGNWRTTDRGATADYYEAENVTIYGTESGALGTQSVNAFIANIETNRLQGFGANILFLSTFASNEHIFGADIVHPATNATTIPVSVTEIGRRVQNTWKGWALTCKLRFLGLPSSFAGSPTLPSLRWVPVGYDADSDRTLQLVDSYNNTMYYADPRSDAGTWSGDCMFLDSEMQNLRRFFAVNRGATFSLAGIGGVLYPFGINRHAATGGYPYSVKLKNIEDERMFGVSRWIAKLTIVEETTI